MVRVPMPNSHEPRMKTMEVDRPYNTMVVLHIVAHPIQLRTVWGSHRCWILLNRVSMYEAAPFAVMSSVPSTTSPTNPNDSAAVARTVFHQGTAM